MVETTALTSSAAATAKILALGHSHLNAFVQGHRRYVEQQGAAAAKSVLVSLQLRSDEFEPDLLDLNGRWSLNETIVSRFQGLLRRETPRLVVSLIRGNEYQIMALLNHPRRIDFELPGSEHLPTDASAEVVPASQIEAILRARLSKTIGIYLETLAPLVARPLVHVPPPPPVPDEDHIRTYPGNFRDRVIEFGVSPAPFRLKMWRLTCKVLGEICRGHGVHFHAPPPASMDENGYLARSYWNKDPTHGNPAYGQLLVEDLHARFADELNEAFVPSQSPYAVLPDHCYWRRAHDVAAIDEVDPVVRAPFKITPEARIATAGSCFAQNIARHLQSLGYTHFVTEKPHPFFNAELAREYNYGVYSARYGNIYTARQLLQLMERAYGRFDPVDTIWRTRSGRFVDAFRPTIEPDGFATARELEIDRARHLQAVREALEGASVFVFTFGLTEAWINRADGAVYPVCPGVAGGRFDAARHAFKNFTVGETVADFLAFVDGLRAVNPRVRIVLTVSPVPLMATAIDRSVITSTVYSKSVLRVACEEIVGHRRNVAYFPAYEIVTGTFARGRYFAEDCRSVTEEGVAHVMKLFMRHYTEDVLSQPAAHALPLPPGVKIAGPQGKPATSGQPVATADRFDEVAEALEVICDEELLDSRASAGG